MKLQGNHNISSYFKPTWFKVRVITGVIALFAFGTVFFQDYLTRNDWIEKKKKLCMEHKDLEYKGVVDTCYADYNNRGFFTAVLHTDTGDKKIYTWYIDYPKAYIQTGDSIVKNKGTFRYIIYREELEPVIVDENFNCDHWEKFRK